MAAYVLLTVFAFALGAALTHAAHTRRAPPERIPAVRGAVPAQNSELTALAAASMFQVNRTLQTELARSRQEVGTEQRKTRVLALEARTDKLTGLPNRRVFDEQIESRIERWQSQRQNPLSLILIDVDHFKQINDRFGHQAGDAALQWLAEIVRRQVGEAGLAARFGGEEFAVLAPQTVEADAAALAEKLRQAISHGPFRHEGIVLRVTASLGVATSLVGEGSKSLMRRADEALYAAKQNGRNRVYRHNGRGSLHLNNLARSREVDHVE